MTRKITTPHYGWVIVFAGMLCIFAGLGFGRFALGMVLPAMAAGLGLNYSQMGVISTVNFVGYLLAVLVCGPLVTRFGFRRVIAVALVLVAGSMMLISRAESFYQVAGFYFLTGTGSGASNVPMVALAVAWFAKNKRGKAIGFMVIGSGFAILISGQLIPWLNSSLYGWRLSWLVLGGIVLLIAAICAILLRNSPDEIGLKPAGTPLAEKSSPPNPNGDADPQLSVRAITHMGVIYFLFGYTYVIYATFIVTCLVQDKGFSEAAAGRFWSWVGLLSLFSGPVFGTLSDRLGRRAGLIAVFSIQTFAYILVAFTLPTHFLYLSIACYGFVAWSIPSIMAALVGDYAGPQKVTRIFSIITLIFACGQISGPAIAGLLAEHSGNFNTSFLMAAIGTGLAVILALGLPRKISAD